MILINNECIYEIKFCIRYYNGNCIECEDYYYLNIDYCERIL